jgi:TonB family protein
MNIRFKWVSPCLMPLLLLSISPAQTDGSDKKCSAPKVSYSPEPSPSYYPHKNSAVTILYLGVDEKGRVIDPQVARPSGSAEFDREALSTIKRWRFKPAMCDGKPTMVYINVEMVSSVKKP